MSSELLQQLLADLRAKRHQARTDHERKVIAGLIADALDGLDASGGTPQIAAVQPNSSPPVPGAERPMSKHSPFYGKGLKEACPKLLSLSADKRPQTPREIWEQLKADGFTSAHSNPVHAVNDALRRRAKTHGDVLLVGSGKWGKTDWYSEDELEEIRKSIGGMGGRDRADHIERTKIGMLTARQRGARLGAVNKLSTEKSAELLDMARSGATVAKIAEKFEISTASVNNYLRRSGHSMRELKREGKMRAIAGNGSADSEPDGTRH